MTKRDTIGSLQSLKSVDIGDMFSGINCSKMGKLLKDIRKLEKDIEKLYKFYNALTIKFGSIESKIVYLSLFPDKKSEQKKEEKELIQINKYRNVESIKINKLKKELEEKSEKYQMCLLKTRLKI
jgi:transcriptional regulator with XRE-family HTH domain